MFLFWCLDNTKTIQKIEITEFKKAYRHTLTGIQNAFFKKNIASHNVNWHKSIVLVVFYSCCLKKLTPGKYFPCNNSTCFPRGFLGGISSTICSGSKAVSICTIAFGTDLGSRLPMDLVGWLIFPGFPFDFFLVVSTLFLRICILLPA